MFNFLSLSYSTRGNDTTTAKPSIDAQLIIYTHILLSATHRHGMAHIMVLNHVSARKTSYLMNDVIRTSRRRPRQPQLIHYWIDSPDVLSYTALIPPFYILFYFISFHPPQESIKSPNLIRIPGAHTLFGRRLLPPPPSYIRNNSQCVHRT